MLAAIMGSAITLGAYQWLVPTNKVVIEHRDGAPVVQTSLPLDGTPYFDFTSTAEKSMPAVVFIKSTQLRQASPRTQRQMPDLFREFFGEDPFDMFSQPRNPRPSIGSGSGVIISEDGYIVTNNHVINMADDIEVSLTDNRTYKAEVIGTDPSTDLALIKIDAGDLPTLPVGNSDEVKVGQWVMAVGNPFNLNSTATAGIVSAKGRNINILRDRSAIESFIQTDAAINPGNSGGALVNLSGELIGINTAIASPTGSYSGYGFAVPANLMRKVVEDLLQYGTVQRGYLGVIIRPVTGTLAEEKGLDITEGVFVDSLLANSAAETAGVKKGDVITAINDRSVRSVSELQAAVGSQRPGDEVRLKLNRDGKDKELAVVLKNQAGNTDIVKSEDTNGLLEKLGVSLEDLNQGDQDKLNLSGGVRVSELSDGILRRSTDIREGFIITHLNQKPVKDKADFLSKLEAVDGGVLLEGRYLDYGGKYYYGFGM